jgi:nitroreductase
MDCKDTIFSRHSIRDFLQQSIPPEILTEMLEAARLAPSSQNRQPWRFIVITDRDKIKTMALKCGLIGLSNFFIRNAPCVIIACADLDSNLRINGQDYYLVDTAIAFQQLMLIAWQHGIGSCWLAAFSEKKLRSWLELPKSWKIVALSPFGYPAEKPGLYSKVLKTFAGSKERLPLDKIVRWLD